MDQLYNINNMFSILLLLIVLSIFQSCEKDPQVNSLYGTWQLQKIELSWGGGTDNSDSTRSTYMQISEDSIATVIRDGKLLSKSKVEFKEGFSNSKFFDSDNFSGLFSDFDGNSFTLYNSYVDGYDYYFQRK